MFQTFLTSNIVEISQNFKSIFFDHLTLITIIIWFERNTLKIKTLINMHGFKIRSTLLLHLNVFRQEKKSYYSVFLLQKFESKSWQLTKFWISIKDEYLLLSNKAERIFVVIKSKFLPIE